MSNQTTDQLKTAKTAFFEKFLVKADSLATQTVHYEPENDILIYGDADAWGETKRVSIEVIEIPNREILSLENRNEDELVDELVDLFNSVAYDVAEFTAQVQARYINENEVKINLDAEGA